MSVEFSSHNIRLDDGTFTKPELAESMERHPWFLSARRVLETVFPGSKSHLRIADLGCLEGGYSVEFARMGFQTLGLDVRESNIARCRYVKARTNLPNLEFVCDDAWNIAKYGPFDAVFCCGLLYHLDRPRQFLQILSDVTKKLLILQTHFSVNTGLPTGALPKFARRALFRVLKSSAGRYGLSRSTENESVRGRWYKEFESESEFRDRENIRSSSWDNRRSFWIQRECLLDTIQAIGFDMVMEQYDGLGPGIAKAMLDGAYRTDSRGTFIGLKTNCT
jgi:SAM-dependent methyltransferase